MKKSSLALLVFVFSMFFVPNVSARNRALILAGAGEDTNGGYSQIAIWNNAILIYYTLLQNGYTNSDIVFFI